MNKYRLAQLIVSMLSIVAIVFWILAEPNVEAAAVPTVINGIATSISVAIGFSGVLLGIMYRQREAENDRRPKQFMITVIIFLGIAVYYLYAVYSLLALGFYNLALKYIFIDLILSLDIFVSVILQVASQVEHDVPPAEVQKKNTQTEGRPRYKISGSTILAILNVVVLVISLGTNIYLTSVNNSISQQNLELQKTVYNYAPFVTGFQQEVTTVRYETQRGTMKAKVVIISPHAGYYNITLVNYTLFQENLDMNHENHVGLEQEIMFRSTPIGAILYDQDIAIWTMLFPSSDYLPPKSLGARIPVARLLFELVYQARAP